MNGTSAYLCEWKEQQQMITVIAEAYSPEASDRERVSDLGESYLENSRTIESLN